MTRLSFITVGVWWFVFTLPVLLRVREPKRRIMPGEEHYHPVQALQTPGATFKDIRRYRDLAMACSPSGFLPTALEPSSSWPLPMAPNWVSASQP